VAKGTLYITATPIGNLKDITLRALEKMKEARLIIAEDTRVTAVLLNHYGIKTKTVSFHKFNEAGRIPRVVEVMENGGDVCMVSDAGSPMISDPGYGLVRECAARGIKCEVLPGASSVIAAITLSGFNPEKFLFAGFIPKKEAERGRFFEGLRGREYPVVLFESPKRVKRALLEIEEAFKGVKASVIKEITKIHETVYTGSPGKIASEIPESSFKGEFVIVLGPQEPEAPEAGAVRSRIDGLKKAGVKTGEAVRLAAAEFKIGRNEAYKIAHEKEEE